MIPLRVFIGYDPRETVALHVLTHSILRQATIPVSITPLVQSALRESGVYQRDRGPAESTEFAFTRFLVPYLSGFEGISLFMDCDMLVRVDLAELLLETYREPAEWSVRVVKHDYVPRAATKFLGQAQTVYPRKNWSSFILFNNAECTALTPENVNSATGLELHRFCWTREEKIGELPRAWNHLVGEYAFDPDARVVHWTNGGPWFPNYANADYAEEWFSALGRLIDPVKESRGQ